MRIENGNAIMDDGTAYYCNGGVIGIDPDLDVSQGWDGSFGPFDDDIGGTVFPPAHRKEIGEYMIALWTRWRDAPAPQEER